jgi:4-alpha-glucanotransferase
VDTITARAAAWGVASGYLDSNEHWVAPKPGSVSRALAAMGAEGPSPPPAQVRVVRAGEMPRLEGPAEVVTEDGAVLAVDGTLPAGLPPGYHRLRHLDRGSEERLIVSPRRCRLPAGPRSWGWAAQLYAVRSQESWGMGDLADLRHLGRWTAGLGARTLMVNPLDAPLPLAPQEPSPYFPSSRRFLNPLYLRVEEVPGATALGAYLEPLAAAGRALNARRLIDRDAIFRLKMQALERVFADFHDSDDFETYRRSDRVELEDYTTFCALSEQHGAPWYGWPVELRHPRSDAVRRFRDENSQRVRFHQWLQWLLERQLAAAAREIGLIQDLPIGARPDGADAWAWQDTFASGVTVGAPPDAFNRAGQDWLVPPFDPWRLRAAGYEPFIRTVRAAFRRGAGLRMDHIAGLFRLYWIPQEVGPAGGVYVRYPHDDLLDILALESQRSGGFVIGEDLGTVEEDVREELAARHILSYRLLYFERRPPAEYPPHSLAAMTTHDLPTLVGIWEGSDPDSGIRERIRRHAGVDDATPASDVAVAAHRALARSSSHLVTATLEDALLVPERPNKPGTTTEWPNWSLALPQTLEELRTDPRPVRLASALRR